MNAWPVVFSARTGGLLFGGEPMAKRQGFVVYHEWREAVKELPLEDAGRLWGALFDYSENGLLPEFIGALRMAFNFMKIKLDYDQGKYETRCNQNRTNINKRWSSSAYDGIRPYTNNTNQNINQNRNQNSNQSQNQKNSRNLDKPRISSRFTPPALEEVKRYCRDQNNRIDPKCFIDFYEARGWKLSSGIAMKDWRAAIRNWENREKKHASGFSYNDTCKEGDSL